MQENLMRETLEGITSEDYSETLTVDKAQREIAGVGFQHYGWHNMCYLTRTSPPGIRLRRSRWWRGRNQKRTNHPMNSFAFDGAGENTPLLKAKSRK